MAAELFYGGNYYTQQEYTLSKGDNSQVIDEMTQRCIKALPE